MAHIHGVQSVTKAQHDKNDSFAPLNNYLKYYSGSQ